MLTTESLQAWLDAYLDAWRTYDPEAIAELFGDGAGYAYHPYDAEPLRGRDAIVASWLEEPDASGTWEAAYRPLLIDGDRAVATGETRYAEGRVFSNLFTLRFDEDGRCSELVEWFMEQPDRAARPGPPSASRS